MPIVGENEHKDPLLKRGKKKVSQEGRSADAAKYQARKRGWHSKGMHVKNSRVEVGGIRSGSGYAPSTPRCTAKKERGGKYSC